MPRSMLAPHQLWIRLQDLNAEDFDCSCAFQNFFRQLFPSREVKLSAFDKKDPSKGVEILWREVGVQDNWKSVEEFSGGQK